MFLAQNVLNYFIGEFQRLKIQDETTRYHILVGNWPPTDVSNYYKLTSPEQRNYYSFRDYCEKRDDPLTDVLEKVPAYNSSTPFGVFLAEATKWARSDENDRIKFFCYHIAPNPLKSKIRENFGESYEIFRRNIQAMWGCLDEIVPLVNNSVNYDWTRRNEQTQKRYTRRYNNHNHANRNQNNHNYDRNSHMTVSGPQQKNLIPSFIE